MPNTLAYLMLIFWPVIGFIIAKKYDPAKALSLLIIVPYLLLPVKVGINPPLLPSISKQELLAITAFIFLYKARKKFIFIPTNLLLKCLVFLLFITPFVTVITNREHLIYSGYALPGLGLTDLVGMLFYNLTLFYLPLILGYNFLNQKDSLQSFISILIICGLVYSIPILWEVRVSPQLHKQVYGFFPHSWVQQIRQGGFRPVVFLGHGLYVAVFISIVAVAAVAFFKLKLPPMKKYRLPKLLFLMAVVVLCKTWSAYIFAAIGTVVILIFRARFWLTCATLFASLVLLYPMLRSANVIPVTSIVSTFAQYSEARASSLNFRIVNEDILLEKARQKPLAGWGGWGRARVRDPVTGGDLSTIDGVWILIFGESGWLGYFAKIGLLCAPVLVLYSRVRRSQNIKEYYPAIIVALLLSLNMLDQIPNSSLNPVTVLMAGALMGYNPKKKRTDIESPVIGNKGA